jgi:excisionase family DNA binding protein
VQAHKLIINPMSSEPTLNLNEAAVMLCAEPETVSKLARNGELPAARIGKGWVFLREDVLTFLKDRINKDTAERRKKYETPKQFAVAIERPTGRANRRVAPELPQLPSIRSNENLTN